MGRWGKFNEDSGGWWEKVGIFFFFLSSGPIVVIANATIDLGPIVTFENVVIGPLLNFFFLVMDYKLLTFF